MHIPTMLYLDYFIIIKSPGKGKKKMQHPHGNIDMVATDS
ncbi:hypothetical protein GYH30_011987 [Glycine max]|nr:hypothetical protein GYH30_011987 [Glycine max]